MTFFQPLSWSEALETRSKHPEAVAVAGGTDVLVELNFDRIRPDSLLDLNRVGELDGTRHEDGRVRIGAGVTYQEIVDTMAADLPALAIASRSVGSPPIRNRGTIGGNLGSASPAGDCHPPLLASFAAVELSSLSASRSVPVDEFFIGPKQSVLRPDELIAAVWVKRSTGPQSFSKVGIRNAMVIAVCSFALALHPDDGRIGTGIGSAGPVPLRARDAEQFLEAVLEETRGWDARRPLEPAAVDHFAELVAQAARPIDDIRGSARYRRHALSVLARRSLTWCWADYMKGR